MTRLIVDPIACDAHGLCAEMLPELITLDDWGYPIIHEPQVSGRILGLARRAVTACPTLALALVDESADDRDPSRATVRSFLTRAVLGGLIRP
jgi:ferredoxin